MLRPAGEVGFGLENAAAEAFNPIVKVEFIYRHGFRTCAEMRLKIATWEQADAGGTERERCGCRKRHPSWSRPFDHRL